MNELGYIAVILCVAAMAAFVSGLALIASACGCIREGEPVEALWRILAALLLAGGGLYIIICARTIADAALTFN